MDDRSQEAVRVVGGVDTHKDLHVAAVVDEQDRVLGTDSFPSTRQGYRLMLSWMRCFGELQRVGIESTGTYGAGLLRHLQAAGVEVLEMHPMSKTVVDAARTTTATPRMRLTRRLPGNES